MRIGLLLAAVLLALVFVAEGRKHHHHAPVVHHHHHHHAPVHHRREHHHHHKLHHHHKKHHHHVKHHHKPHHHKKHHHRRHHRHHRGHKHHHRRHHHHRHHNHHKRHHAVHKHARQITKREAEKLVQKAAKAVKVPQPIDTCSFWGDPHFTAYNGTQYNVMPEGDALLIGLKNHPWSAWTRHHHWGFTGAIPTVATGIAVRTAHDDVVEYDAPLQQFRRNGNIVNIAVGQTLKLNQGTIKRTSALAFEVEHKKKGKITVTDAGGSMPYLNVVVQLPRDVSSKCVDSLCGHYKGGGGHIVTHGNIFTTPYSKDSVHYSPTPVSQSDKDKEAAYKLCSKLSGEAFKTCVFDYSNTPQGHRHNIVKKSVAAHSKRANILVKIIKKAEAAKKNYEKKVLKAIQKATKNLPAAARKQCNKAAQKHIKKVEKKIAVKVRPTGLKSKDKKIKKLVKKVKRAAQKRLKHLKVKKVSKHDKKAKRLVNKAIKKIPVPQPIDTCAFNGDPHYLNWRNVRFDIMPEGDAVVAATKKGDWVVHARHHHYLYTGALPTVATSIAVRVNKRNWIEYNGPQQQFRKNGKIITPAVGSTLKLGKGASLKVTGALTFEVVASNTAKVAVSNSGGSVSYLNIVITAPRKVTEKLLPSCCGSYKSGENQKVPAEGLFTLPYSPDEVHYSPNPPTQTDKDKEAAYKACSKLSGQAVKSCVFDYLNSGPNHKADVAKKALQFHKRRGKIIQKIIKKIEKAKKKYEKKVAKAVAKIVKKHPSLKHACHKLAKKQLKKVDKKTKVKQTRSGVKSLDKKIKKLIKKVKKNNKKRLHNLSKKLNKGLKKAKAAKKSRKAARKLKKLQKANHKLQHKLKKCARKNHKIAKKVKRSKLDALLKKTASKYLKKVHKKLSKSQRKAFKKAYKKLRKTLIASKKAGKKGGKKAAKAQRKLVKLSHHIRKLVNGVSKKTKRTIKKGIKSMIKKAFAKKVTKKVFHKKCRRGLSVAQQLKKINKKYRRSATTIMLKLLKKHQRKHKCARRH